MRLLDTAQELVDTYVAEGKRKQFFLSLGITVLFVLEAAILLVMQGNAQANANSYIDPTIATPIKKIEPLPPPPDPDSQEFNAARPFNIFIAGIDRRGGQTSFRSDINLLVTLSADRKKVLLTSIPRDLWLDGERINAFITTEGIDSTKEKIYQVTGMRVDRYVQVDFDAFAEGIDALGGVDVTVERTFTDSNYPDDRNGNENLIAVTFNQGVERMNGERALIFSRSRKGNNGEGSDFGRMKRQQQIIKAMPEALLSPRTIFNPFVLQNFYNAVTGRFKTDFSLKDVELAYELVKNYQSIQIEHLVMDHTYVYSPPLEQYGGASVLRPQNESFDAIRAQIQSLIN